MGELLLGVEVLALLVKAKEFVPLTDAEELLLVVEKKEMEGKLLDVKKD